MKVSVVTISFNQAQFLERTIRSVLAQSYKDFEYIIVDPGSTDGSREIIESYRSQLSHVIFEKDRGPADGLNKGFAQACGDIFFYLNSDDTIYPRAFEAAIQQFEKVPDSAVIRGHAWIVDAEDRRTRRFWSDPFNLRRAAYGVVMSVQQSTYIRADWFRRVGGFNVANKTSWDGELVIDIALAGGNIGLLDDFISSFRVHDASISGTSRGIDAYNRWRLESFERIIGRPWSWQDPYIHRMMWLGRQLRHPRGTLERLLHGPIFP